MCSLPFALMGGLALMSMGRKKKQEDQTPTLAAETEVTAENSADKAGNSETVSTSTRRKKRNRRPGAAGYRNDLTIPRNTTGSNLSTLPAINAPRTAPVNYG